MRFKYEPVPDFINQFEKLTRKDRKLRERAIKKIDQILDNPEIGEPKRYRLKMARGIHVNPFVIVYMIVDEKASYVLEKTALNYPDLLVNDGSPERNDNDDEP